MTKLDIERHHELGRGGSGRVRAATLLDDGRPLAVKELTGAQSSAALRAEAEILAKLDHPNIVRFIGLHEGETGQLELVTERVDGVTLDRLLDSGPIPATIALYITLEVLAALAYLNRAQKLVHRDLSPRNILLSRDGTVKVVDFGLATLQWAARTTATVKATVPYASPEQLLRVGLDARSDLFSLGVILYEMLTGKLPYGDTTDDKDEGLPITPVKVLRPGLPEELYAAIGKMLAHDRDDRPGSAVEVIEALPGAPCGADDLSVLLSERPLEAEEAEEMPEAEGDGDDSGVQPSEDSPAPETPAIGSLWRPARALALLAAGALLGVGGLVGFQALVGGPEAAIERGEPSPATRPEANQPAEAGAEEAETPNPKESPESSGDQIPVAHEVSSELDGPARLNRSKRDRSRRPTPTSNADLGRGRSSPAKPEPSPQPAAEPGTTAPSTRKVWAPTGTTVYHPAGRRETVE